MRPPRSGALIVISSSRGAAGADLLAVCRRYGMRLLGPSCFGVMMPWIGLDATFTAVPTRSAGWPG